MSHAIESQQQSYLSDVLTQQYSTTSSPFARFNLRRNPFGELTREERAEVAIVDSLDVWLNWLSVPNRVLQFLGNCGFTIQNLDDAHPCRVGAH